MKYFTKDLWVDIQDKKKFKKTKEKWEIALVEYQNQFEQLEPRIPSEIYEFIKQNSLHDGKLSFMEVLGECNLIRPNGDKRQPLSVLMKISSGYSEDIFIFEYKGVKKLYIDYSPESKIFEYNDDGLGYIGYDELTVNDDAYLNHEFLFTTGATIEVSFKEINAYLLEEGK